MIEWADAGHHQVGPGRVPNALPKPRTPRPVIYLQGAPLIARNAPRLGAQDPRQMSRCLASFNEKGSTYFHPGTPPPRIKKDVPSSKACKKNGVAGEDASLEP